MSHVSPLQIASLCDFVGMSMSEAFPFLDWVVLPCEGAFTMGEHGTLRPLVLQIVTALPEDNFRVDAPPFVGSNFAQLAVCVEHPSHVQQPADVADTALRAYTKLLGEMAILPVVKQPRAGIFQRLRHYFRL